MEIPAMKPVSLVSSVLCALLALTSCSGDEPPPSTPGDPLVERQLPENLREDAATVVAGNNRFAIDMFRELRSADGNLFFSPFSISTAFAMVYGGARGTTGAEIAEVFHFSPEPAQLHAVYREILKSLDTGAGFDGYRLNIANRLWGHREFRFLDDYLALTRENYGAELETVDFVADPEAARTRINGWVEDKTEERITDLFPAGSINNLTRLVLANAIYFKGTWEHQFDPAQTRDTAFQVTPARHVTVPMMNQNGEFRLARAEGLQILELPYAGRDLSMLVILPDAVDGLAQIEEQLTLENLDAWRGGLGMMDVMVSLPRFTITSQFGLNDWLATLGMPTAFTEQADLSGMNGDGGLLIQSAVHKAFVTVNEEGTEAAAATGISVGVTSAPPSFRADHQFLFLIVDNVTGSLLFVGRVVEPTL
jgi:serpin B